MNENISILYKILENPRCIKYYEELLDYYKKNKKTQQEIIYKLIIEEIKNDSSMHGN